MLKKLYNKVFSKIKNRRLLIVVLLLFFAVNIFAIFNTFSEKTTSSIWDGTVGKKFASGDGSSKNPYIIKTGNELSYLFTLINSEESGDYITKFYEIKNNIDLNGYSFSFADLNKVFSGNINGNGFAIYNFKIDNYYLDESGETASFALFDTLYGADIKNINLSQITIVVKNVKSTTEKPTVEGTISTSTLSPLSSYATKGISLSV